VLTLETYTWHGHVDYIFCDGLSQQLVYDATDVGCDLCVQRVVVISSSVLTRAAAFQLAGSAMVIMTAAIIPTNATAVSNISHFIQLIFCDVY